MNSDLRPTVSAANVKAIGFDIGGTKIAFGVIDALGNVVTEQQSHRTPHDPAETVGTIREIVSDMRRRHADVAAIGVGAAGLVDCCLLYTSPSPRDRQKSRMPSSA